MSEITASLSGSGVASRFVSSDEIDAAKARRDEQWKAAYARFAECYSVVESSGLNM